MGLGLPGTKVPSKALYSLQDTVRRTEGRLSSTWTVVQPGLIRLREAAGTSGLLYGSSTLRPRTSTTPGSGRSSRGQLPLPFSSALFRDKDQKFLLAGRKAGLDRLNSADPQSQDQRPSGSKELQSDASDSSDHDSSQEYSFLAAAKKRAIEEDSCSSSSSSHEVLPAAQHYFATRTKGTVLLFTNDRKKYVRFSASPEKEWQFERTDEVKVTARVAGGCLWLGVCLELNGLVASRSRFPAVRLTVKYQPRCVSEVGVYNHIPGSAALYRQDRFLATIQSGLWPEVVPLSFNTAQETFSFSRYRSAHPKSLWIRKALEGKSKLKVIPASSRGAEKR